MTETTPATVRPPAVTVIGEALVDMVQLRPRHLSRFRRPTA